MYTILKPIMELYRELVNKLMYVIALLTILIILVFFGVINHDKIWSTQLEDPILDWNPYDIVLNNPKVPEDVKEGFLLLDSSAIYMGPLNKDPKLRFSGNNLSCTNCHLNGGTKSGAAPWFGMIDRFPQFSGRSNNVGTLVERINGCMERSMNGIAFPENASQMKKMIAYMEWLDYGAPKLNSKKISGYPSIEIPFEAVDKKVGEEIYLRECVVCHGKNGEGILYQDSKKGYQYPPLWGNDTYNDGAGMNRVLTAAAFIKNNMPYLQATWENPKLSDEEAYHVAGYINSFPRPSKKNKEMDYPDKKLKPISTPYGPWSDNFSSEQHKYGPYPPMIEYYKKTFGIKKSK